KTSSRISTLNNSRKFARLPRSLLYGSQTSRAPKTLQAQKGPASKNDCGAVRRYWMVLATEEKALLAFEPTRRIVPTTKTKITSITAYSAMSWPRWSVQSWGRILICLQFLSTAKIRTLGWKCQRQERPSAAGPGIRNLVLISLWRLSSRARRHVNRMDGYAKLGSGSDIQQI